MMTTAQIQSWLRDPATKAQFNGDYVAYKKHCNNPRPATPPVVTPAKTEVPKMTNTEHEKAGAIALAEIKQIQAEYAAGTRVPISQKIDRAEQLASLTPQQREQFWRDEFNASAALQAEFRGVETWLAYKKSQHRGWTR